MPIVDRRPNAKASWGGVAVVSDLRMKQLSPFAGLLFALFAVGCDNKCDELVGTLADCIPGDVGGEETDETEEDPEGDTECSGEDEACATCVLEAKIDLCTAYGEALEGCRASGDCK